MITPKNTRFLTALACIVCLVVSIMLPSCTSGAVDDVISDLPPEASHEPAPIEQTEQNGDWPDEFSLCEAYKDDFLIGTIYTDASRTGKDNELTLRHFNAITPENIMKPEYMQPSNGTFHFNESDVMMDFAQQSNLKVIGHTLAWHQQTGDWLGKNVSREEAIGQLRNHITNIVGKYKGKIIAWDVVNEAIADDATLPADGDWTKCLRKTQWLDSIGSDYIALAFTFAREADPDVTLYYNDYNLDSKKKADIVYAMVKDLREKDIPVDGIGMQGHYNLDTSPNSVKAVLEMFSELGVEISITELDITVNDATAAGLTEEQEIKQAIVYAQLFSAFKEYKDAIARVTFWGYVDNKSWRAERFPCLFNADFTPKQAAYAVLDPEKYLTLHNVETAVPAKIAEAKYGSPVIDAEIDDVWGTCPEITVNNAAMAWEGAKGTVRVLWDETTIYVLFEVMDSVLNKSSPNEYEHDSVEIFLDQNMGKTAFYETDDGQYRVNFEGLESFGTIPDKTGFASKAKIIDGGYLIEMAIPLVLEAKEGMKMGFDAQVNDSDDTGARQSIMKFNDLTNNSYLSAEKWGELLLVK